MAFLFFFLLFFLTGDVLTEKQTSNHLLVRVKDKKTYLVEKRSGDTLEEDDTDPINGEDDAAHVTDYKYNFADVQQDWSEECEESSPEFSQEKKRKKKKSKKKTKKKKQRKRKMKARKRKNKSRSRSK